MHAEQEDMPPETGLIERIALTAEALRRFAAGYWRAIVAALGPTHCVHPPPDERRPPDPD